MNKKRHTPLIIGNWKLNPTTVGEAKQLFLSIRRQLGRRKSDTHVSIAPPFPFLSELEKLSPSQNIKLSAQDVFFENAGAHTGLVSLPMLQSVGVSSVIVGHSELRTKGESDEDIHEKVKIVCKGGSTAILCVGEKVRDQQGDYFGVIEKQVHSAIKDLPKSKLNQLVIAYEPVWAIGTGKNATPEDVHEMKLFIQKVLVNIFGRTVVNKVRIIYGGSVNESNATALLEQGEVDGFLIGGVSLKPTEFTNIVRLAESYEKTAV